MVSLLLNEKKGKRKETKANPKIKKPTVPSLISEVQMFELVKFTGSSTAVSVRFLLLRAQQSLISKDTMSISLNSSSSATPEATI